MSDLPVPGNTEFIIYQTEDGQTRVQVRIENETVWLTQNQLVELFQSSKANISEHIKHIFEEGELYMDSVVRNFRTTAADGKSYNVAHYNLDVIISVGYRRLATPTERFLLKLHGDRTKPISRVLTPTEYDRAYGPSGLVRSELTLVYQHNHLLFLGCSLGADRTVQVIGEVAVNDPHMPRHYAFLADPLDDGCRITREHFLVSRNIYPIW